MVEYTPERAAAQMAEALVDGHPEVEEWARVDSGPPDAVRYWVSTIDAEQFEFEIHLLEVMR